MLRAVWLLYWGLPWYWLDRGISWDGRRTCWSSGRRPLGERIVWSVPLSFGFTTMVAVMVGKYGSLGLACWVLAGMGVVAAAMIGVEVLRGGRLRVGWAGVVVGVVFALFVVGELVDIGFGHKLYMSVTVYDNALRTAFVEAVVRTGVPPGNPLYWTVSETGVGHAAPMRYYYFWYVVCGLVVKIVGVSARQAMIASCVWAGFGLAAVIGLYCRYFLRPANSLAAARRRIWITVGLLAVTGLDIIPVIVAYLQGQPTDPDMEWWSSGAGYFVDGYGAVGAASSGVAGVLRVRVSVGVDGGEPRLAAAGVVRGRGWDRVCGFVWACRRMCRPRLRW